MTRELGLGSAGGSAYGERGIEKRLRAMNGLVPLVGGRLLDIGCASGAYTMRLAPRFDRTDAIDIEPERLDMFRAGIASWEMPELAERITVRQMSANALDYPDATFDVVTAIEVVEHVADLASALAEVARVLRPGGAFVLTTPNRWFPLETHGPIIAGRRLSPLAVPGLPWVRPLHRRLADARAFGRRELVAAVEAHGLRLVGASYMMPPFDRSRLGSVVRPVTEWMERTRGLRALSMTHVMAFRREEAR